ncbi:AAA family ATPase, partial [Pseudomonas viridiflava]|uniref:AAA family ATPase n=1 Tax=Pseudomonas viridiflava TaxID=33069 RepID=UPI001F15340D
MDFEGNKLILLDGPNGYGKTSIFDAVELALTGNISRLITLDNRQNPADIVVAHKNATSVEILLESKDENYNTRTFQRKLKGNITAPSKRIARFAELWELNEIIDGIAEPAKKNILEHFFDSKDFARDFLLFH